MHQHFTDRIVQNPYEFVWTIASRGEKRIRIRLPAVGILGVAHAVAARVGVGNVLERTGASAEAGIPPSNFAIFFRRADRMLEASSGRLGGE
jgi:hypothetical protein